jgi:hypothetical protein
MIEKYKNPKYIGSLRINNITVKKKENGYEKNRLETF